MEQIFISYHRNDIDFSSIVRTHLEAAGFNVWIDVNKLQAGDDWRDGIDRGILESIALIVVMTPDAKSSEYVAYEWAFALGAEIRVIPLLLKTTSLHPRLSAIQYLDFRNPTIRPWDKLIEDLKRIQADATSQNVRLPKDAPRYLKKAFEALENPSEKDRADAILCIRYSTESIVPELLLSALQNPFVNVRSGAAKAFTDKKNIIDFNRIVPLLSHSKDGIRSTAVSAIGNMHNEQSFDYIANCINDKSARVRIATVDAIKKFDDVRVIDVLKIALRDNADNIRVKTLRILVSMYCDELDVKLISKDFDGVEPFRDPMDIITDEVVIAASRELGLLQNEIRERYNNLSRLFSLRLAWDEEESAV